MDKCACHWGVVVFQWITAIDFVKLKVMHTVVTERVTDSVLALVRSGLGTVAPFTDRTTVCIKILECIVHTYTCLGLICPA